MSRAPSASGRCALDPTRRDVLAGLAGGLAAPALAGGGPAHGASASPPHIVVILADDLGFSDLGCFGGEIATPRLDALAASGLRLSTFYSTGRCCPSRAALLTGRYPHAVDVGHMGEDTGVDGYRGRLRPGVPTVAEILRQVGYRTLCVGKWHLGSGAGDTPTDRGFDHFYGFLDAGGVYYGVRGDRPLIEDGRVIATSARDLPQDWYSTDAFVDRAMGWLDQSLDQGRPTFLYLPLIAPHNPLQAPQGRYEALRGSYQLGWDELRQARAEAAVAMSVLPPGTPVSVRDPMVPAWARLSPDEQDRADAVMAMYAAVVGHADAAVGRLVDHLHQRGVARDTVILFCSDNGASGEADPVGRFVGPGEWGSRWSRAHLGSGWANACNAPFRRFKGQAHEGGIRSPCIVSWPGGLPEARRGEVLDAPAHLVDLFPTLLDLAGADERTRRRAARGAPLAGQSLLPLLAGQDPGERTFGWEHEGHRALRRGRWKVVSEAGQPWALYDLRVDPTESLDLAAAFPEVLGPLVEAWQAWADAVGVRPWSEVAPLLHHSAQQAED